jgi:23S rRNA (cytidine1920-2'-O)/16S rRNA (cytidine1409-2'-O)-methyltransferase
MAKRRIDSLLMERGLFESRTRAAAAVLAGDIRLGEGGRQAQKPGQLVGQDTPLAVAQKRAYVSRGGHKLENALQTFDIRASDRLCLDVGAATGGFSDCLLKHGAQAVTVVDVAYGELDWRLRCDERVEVLERTNARWLNSERLRYRPDLVVIDVSFISLCKVLAPVLSSSAKRFDCLALVKPQFELERGLVGRGGVVRSASDRRSALVSVGRCVESLGYGLMGYAPSGLSGPAGNRETFAWITEAKRLGAHTDCELMARQVEP